MLGQDLDLGVAAARNGKADQAVEHFSRAVETSPHDAEARAWLGQGLCRVGRRFEGAAELGRAAAAFLGMDGGSPDPAKAMETIRQLQQWGDVEASLPLVRRLAELRPLDPRTHQLLAATCGQLNLLPEALMSGERALSLASANAALQVQQASLEADAGFLTRARRRLEDALGRPLDARNGLRAHKELARICDAEGDHAAVFPHVNAAAALAPSVAEYLAQDPRRVPGLLAAARAQLDEPPAPRVAPQDLAAAGPAPIFVMGFYRSGTTLAERVLATHPDVFVADEADLVGELRAAFDQSSGGKLGALDPAKIRALRALYWSRASARYGPEARRGRFVDKFTMNTIDVALIDAVFPDAKLIFLLRDPRDVCLSSVLQLMPPTPATIHLLTLGGAAAFYAAVMDFWFDVRGRLAAPVLEVRYEDAVSDFDATFKAMFAFADLGWTEAAREFHRGAVGRHVASPSRNQVARPLYASSVGRWRPYAAEFEAVEDHLQPFVDALGYA